ncbi:MAG TPA: MBL fold metallo-hydrolase [Candidatus Elarobacter sp.]|nr:MBL fold metallo-hydrolase [Candidatus Elarobacter sp.]
MSDPLSRGEFFQVSAAAGAVQAVGTGGTVAANVPGAGGPVAAGPATSVVPLRIRWYGGGVYELAPPDDSVIVLVDAWIWNNTGFKAFNIDKPPELSSAAAYTAYLKARNPQAVIVALSHDHGDHMGDYFELLPALLAGGLDVKTIGQSDMMRVGLVPKFKAAGLDEAQVVLNNGAGVNLGGTATYKGVRIEAVPAVHSTTIGFPAIGFIIDVGGVRVYASGDTDLYGDMALIATRYRPDLAVVCTGNGAFTMGPGDAAHAVKMTGAGQAIPVHYAHNPLVIGPQCGDQFRAAMADIAPQTTVTLLKPGEKTTLRVAALQR